MGNHSPEGYKPVKTSTIVVLFFALAGTITFGLYVGDTISVLPKSPNDIVAVAPQLASPPVVPAARPEAAESTSTVTSVETATVTAWVVPVASSSSSQAVRTPSEPSTTTVAPSVSEVQTPVVAPAPAPIVEVPTVVEIDEKDSPEEICIQQGEEWDGTQCVAVQLPEEIIGRVVDGPDGQICTIIDVLGTVNCVVISDEELVVTNG